jgi:hypothetical protein
MLTDYTARLAGRKDRGVSSRLPAKGLGMTCLGRTGWQRPVQPPPGKMVQDGGETVDVPPSEAAAEAVAGLEAEVTTVAEVTVVAPATSMAAGEEVAVIIEFALVPLCPVSEWFFFFAQ